MTSLEGAWPAAVAAAMGSSKITFHEDGGLLFKYDGPGLTPREMDLVHRLAVKVRLPASTMSSDRRGLPPRLRCHLPGTKNERSEDELWRTLHEALCCVVPVTCKPRFALA